MVNDVIAKAIQMEVEAQVESYVGKYENLKKNYVKLSDDHIKLKAESSELLSKLKQLEAIKSFSDNITIETIESAVICNLNYNPTDISFSGMRSEEIPMWFKILCRYFDNKNEILNLFNIFNIEYPNWAKDIILPSHYNKQQLKLCLNNSGQLYVCNGQIYEGNMGFYYTYHRRHNFDLETVFKRESYVEIPFQLLLKNKLLIEDDELFDLLLEKLHNEASHISYFMKLVYYQDVPIDKVLKLLSPTKSGAINYKSIVGKYPELLKSEHVGESLKQGISENGYSELYLLKFNKEVQKEYLLNRENKDLKFVELIDKSMEFNTEEKAELIKLCYMNKVK
ncbi:hypothetical protein FJQ98_16395 [Lysinibacillus agricola]|uniref:Uncharacterized protein n=1 Tax=Lysinibacillus agricola TaxID=2590012 RepID=A0ABX7AM09_9BACI|nr:MULTISPECIES: hypothetical protein [Lysinibacillus]KOS61487.1 hypothetical protein AN161_18015 [Lysinibacillus sp. FJAT-14222]QQP10825.1 hypothetical protein FJQ98_16395 [Lysinibacillus agricola]